MSRGKARKNSSAERTTSWCCAPTARAATRAKGSSLLAGASKPTANVWMRSLAIGAMRAASPVESSPSDRNRPSGTSLMRWLRTVASSRSERSAARCAKPGEGSSGPVGRDQLRCRRGPPRPRPGEDVARWELADALKEGLVTGEEAGREELGDGRRVQRRPTGRHGKDRLDLGGKQQLSVVHRVVQGLDPEPIPGEQEALPLPVPEGEGEHPLQPLHAGVALFLVKVQDRLGVAPGLIPMPLRLQPGSERGVVIDLPVVGNPHPAVLVRHRLLPARDVHDGQAAVAEAYGPIDPQSLAIGPAVTEDVSHSLEARLLGCLPGVELHDADDSTHTG